MLTKTGLSEGRKYSRKLTRPIESGQQQNRFICDLGVLKGLRYF
jgi:hypothetical protein